MNVYAVLFKKFYYKPGVNMAYKITDACVNCGACEGDCPVNAITEQGDTRVIDAEKCIDCGTCAAECPAEAIVEE